MKRFWARIIRFGLTKRLRRGGKVTIFPSYHCNFACEYCSLRVNGKIPRNKILSFEDWKNFLIKYDKTTIDNGGIREVILTGGEPTLLPYFVELCHWILFEKKWHLTMFTNLSNCKLLFIKPSIRLRVGATFHHHADLSDFDINYKKLNKIHRIDVEEIVGEGDKKYLSYSKAKPYLTEYEIKNLATCIRVAPDQSMYLTCREACEKFCNE